MRVLFIDNFDSFTYNLVDELEKRGVETLVYRNDVSLATLERVVADDAPDLLMISPGPSDPPRAGVCLEAVKRFAGELPIFGVCLGHQVIVEAFGGRVDRAPVPVHGKSSAIEHDGQGVFDGLPSPLTVGRYHSLVGVEIPETLEVSARVGELIMAVRHKEHQILGVQFHPESILTPNGGRLLERVLAWTSEGSH